MPAIHEIATLTSKGQITLPKPIRQALGVASGGRVAFDFDGAAIVVSRADAEEHVDPAIGRFLALIERDIASGNNVSALPAPLARSLKRAARAKIDLAADIEGAVSL